MKILSKDSVSKQDSNLDPRIYRNTNHSIPMFSTTYDSKLLSKGRNMVLRFSAMHCH